MVLAIAGNWGGRSPRKCTDLWPEHKQPPNTVRISVNKDIAIVLLCTEHMFICEDRQHWASRKRGFSSMECIQSMFRDGNLKSEETKGGGIFRYLFRYCERPYEQSFVPASSDPVYSGICQFLFRVYSGNVKGLRIWKIKRKQNRVPDWNIPFIIQIPVLLTQGRRPWSNDDGLLITQ